MALERNPLVVWGLKELAFADLGKVDTATWEQLSLTKQGTFSMSFDPAAITPIKAEEISDAIATKVVSGDSQTFELDIPDLSPEVLQFFGGTVTTTGAGATKKKRIAFPKGAVVLKKMVRITPMEGISNLYVTHATITFNPSGGFTKTGDDTFNIHLTVSVNAALGGTLYESDAIMYDIADPEP